MPKNDRRRVTVQQWMEWKRSDTPFIRVQIANDETPSGLAMAMALSW